VKRLVTVAASALALGVSLAACSAPDRTPAVPVGTPPATTAAAAGSDTCSPPATATYRALGSLPSPSSLPSGSLEQKIRQRGRLVVGVSSDTRLLGARNLSNNQLEGFDIDVAKRVAQAIFGDASKVQFRTISAGDRIPFLQKGADNGGVDMVARAMTMTCSRWKDVAFAGPYFQSYLKVLVSSSTKAAALGDLRGKRVCATNGSTTIAKVAATLGKDSAVGVPLTTDCMVLWQQGQVDAIAADDAILAGLKDQDPAAKIVGTTNVESEPYGLAINKDHPEFVQFVNAVLDGMRGGAWQSDYKSSGLADALGARTQPPADYSRPLP
jgi:polar amino acid transport system substrate-binding protein